MRNRIKEIKEKGFNIAEDRTPVQEEYENIAVNFNKVKIGAKSLEDAVYSLGDLKKANPRYADKDYVMKVINEYNIKEMREISNFYYMNNGIYQRVIRYMAFIYRYDWVINTYVNDTESIKEQKLLTSFNKALKSLEDFEVKKRFNDIALKVLLNGAYYGYLIETASSFTVQELPPNYCRSRFETADNKAAVEFNMKFFDEYFSDAEQRMKMLKLFPDEFARGYLLYKQGKLPPLFKGDTAGWYLLDPNNTVKFNAIGYDYPMFISAIPALIDLDAAQDLDRKKTAQKLLKILIQKMPLDKNGDLIFDVDEAQQLHNNAVQMLKKAIGVDILTTFADVDVESLSENNSVQNDDLKRIERQVFNTIGSGENLFNSDGNIALEKSALNDAATMYPLLLQFESFLNVLISKYNTQPKKFEFKVQLLTTTIYNYQELSKLYKEQTQLGYSKMLPQIALGQSQRSILANAYFENDILDLVNVFIPPVMSSTMNSDMLKKGGNDSDGKAGRKEKPDDQKSEKTIQNRESMN